MDKEEVVHIYNEILLIHQKEQNNANYSNMYGPRDCQTEWSKANREEKKKTYHVSLICRIFKKTTNELVYKTDIELHMKTINL